ncbi:MAG: His/Gly/Thr/Pro-type tRNA ligase C-terminal domain-containing protein [Bacteroidota bacterium]
MFFAVVLSKNVLNTSIINLIDTQTLQDQTVTIRERDSMQQVRVAISSLLNYLLEKLR